MGRFTDHSPLEQEQNLEDGRERATNLQKEYILTYYGWLRQSNIF